MKILHINNYTKRGGAETVFNLTRKNPAATKNYSGYIKTEHNGEKPDIQFFSWENNNKLIGSINYIFSYKNYKALYKFLLNNEIDVVHLQVFYSPISPSILLALKRIKKKKPIKIIETLHGYHLICPNVSLFNYSKSRICEKCIGKKIKLYILKDNCDGRGYIYSLLKGIRNLISLNIIGHKKIVDHFIAPSEFLKNKLIEDGVEEKKTIVLRNPVTSLSGPIGREKENIICYFGRFSREKNLEFLVKAFLKWKSLTKTDFKLLLIGDGEEKDTIKSIIKDKATNNDIILRDFMSYDDLMKEVTPAKFFALTSKCYENFPVSIAEAISLNIIPIVPSLGGMRESVAIYFKVGGIYEAEDYDSWISTINYLVKNYEKEIKKILNIKKNLFNELSPATYLNRVCTLYKN